MRSAFALAHPARIAVRTLVVLAASLAVRAGAQTVPTGFTVVTVASGLATPVAFEFLPDGRVLFAEQSTGNVRLLMPNGSVQASPVLTVPGVVAGGERGLLGLAIDPRFPAAAGCYLYVFHDAANPSRIRISRFALAGDLTNGGSGVLVADPASRYDLVDDIPDVNGNHNGGTLRFGPDGALYASIGEDGVPCAAQDTTSLRGVILRLRTEGLPAGAGRAFRAQVAPFDNPFAAAADSNARLVIALGLRNPFRFQVDPPTGALVIGDVGESLREELDVLRAQIVYPLGPRGTTPSGANDPGWGADFGWPYLEGTAPGAHRLDCAPAPALLAGPIFEYDRTQQSFGAAIISAGLYRPRTGSAVSWPSEYEADILASDYYSGQLRRLVPVTSSTWSVAPPVPGQSDPEAWGTGFAEVSDWRVGPDGALWFCRQSVGFAAGTGSIGYIAGPGGPAGPPLLPLELRVLDTPGVHTVRFLFPSGTPIPARLTLHDMNGRVVRQWGNDEVGGIAAGRFLTWDGHDGDGRSVPPGLYVVRLESGARAVSARVVLLR